MTYVVITFLVLLFLNIYCAKASHSLFHQSKEAAMTGKCQLAADEISQLEVLNADGIRQALAQMGSVSTTRTVASAV